MADYRLIMALLLQEQPYRQIQVMAGCSHRAISRARRVLDAEHLTTPEQIHALTAEDLERFFTDGRRSVTGEFVPIDIDKVIAARIGWKKPPLKVLWAQYLKIEAAPGARFYGYDRFCEIVTEHARVNDLTSPITHVSGHTMQVDWAGTRMQLTDPITRRTTGVSVFVASLPYSGLVFAYGYLDEKQPAWLDAHRRAFEYFTGVPLVVVPDNASTASNQISKTERARDVNPAYAEFLEYYRTAAVPARAYRPRDKGHVESGVKVVTNWVIHYLADQVFSSLDDLNEAIVTQIEAINHRTPFRGEARSRRDWFEEHERSELLDLPTQRWEPVVWGLPLDLGHVISSIPVGRERESKRWQRTTTPRNSGAKRSTSTNPPLSRRCRRLQQILGSLAVPWTRGSRNTGPGNEPLIRRQQQPQVLTHQNSRFAA